MAAQTSRTERILLRVSPAEKELIRERAGGARRMSDYIRRRAIGDSTDWNRRPAAPEPIGPSVSYEARVLAKMKSNGVPRASAEILVKREMARERV